MVTGAWCFNKSMGNKPVVNPKKHPSQHSPRSAKKKNLCKGLGLNFGRGDRIRSKFNVLRGSAYSTIFSMELWCLIHVHTAGKPSGCNKLDPWRFGFPRGSQPSLWGYDPWSLKKKHILHSHPNGCFLNTPQPRKKMEKRWEDWGEDVIHGTMHNPWVLTFTNYLIAPPSMQSLSISVICTVGMIMFD